MLTLIATQQPVVTRRLPVDSFVAVGVDDVVFWGFPDGHVPSPGDLARGAAMAADALRSFAPDVVYLPWAREGHPDARATSAAEGEEAVGGYATGLDEALGVVGLAG